MFYRGIFLSLRSNLAGLFNNDEAVAKLVSGIVPLLAAYQVRCAYIHPNDIFLTYSVVMQIVDGIAATTTGILRACGKIATGALSNFIGYYVLGKHLPPLLRTIFTTPSLKQASHSEYTSHSYTTLA